MEIVNKIYEIIHEMYPDIQLDVWGEPESVFVFESKVNYHPPGSLIRTILYGDYRAVKDKEILLEVHFYSDKPKDFDEFEKVEREIELTEPDRTVKLELLSSEIVSFQGIFDKVYRLRVIDQVFEVDVGKEEMTVGRIGE